MERFTVRFWGVRGSVAAGGTAFAGIGGNTSCVEVRAGDEIIILDAGTGVFPLGRTLGKTVRATFLLSHFHWDHIQGFPLFRPAYIAGNTFTFFGPGKNDAEPAAAFAHLMQAPHFPVELGALAARLDFRAIRPGDEIHIGPARVCAAALNHPQGCLGYRICVDGARLVYATDTEQPESGVLSPAVFDLIRDADLLIYDAQYTDDEYFGRTGPPRQGWGHSTVTEACAVARAAGVKQLALFHHDPTHTDRVVERIVRKARALFPNTIAAREGLELDLFERAEQRARRQPARYAPAPVQTSDAPEATDMACAPAPHR